MVYNFRFIVKDSNDNIIKSSVESMTFETEVTFHEIAHKLAESYDNFEVESCMACGQDVSHTDKLLDDHYFMAITIKLK